MASLVRNGDGFWACTGPGTLNDARGRSRTELAAATRQAAESVSEVELAQEMAAYDLGDT
jgi:hypothetical protein